MLGLRALDTPVLYLTDYGCKSKSSDEFIIWSARKLKKKKKLIRKPDKKFFSHRRQASFLQSTDENDTGREDASMI